jgi:hypothetical protein
VASNFTEDAPNCAVPQAASTALANNDPMRITKIGDDLEFTRDVLMT